MNICPYCGGGNTKKQGTLPSGKKRFYCKDCKKGYSTYLINDEPHLECVYCSSHNTVRAGKTKHGVQIYKCNECGRRFNEDKTKLDLDALCPHCGGVIAYKGWSNDGTVRRYICKSCRRTFSGDVNHLNIKEKIIEKPCPYCGSHNIRKGGKLKSGLKRYKCNDCGKGYNESTIIEEPKHRPEKCPHCGGTHINLSGHDTKTGKQRYKCITCGKKFVENPTQPTPTIWEKKCPVCGHIGARKAGKTSGKQYYQCLECNHKYLENPCYTHLTPKQKEIIKEYFYRGEPKSYIAMRTSINVKTIYNACKGFEITPRLKKKMARLLQLRKKQFLAAKKRQEIKNQNRQQKEQERLELKKQKQLELDRIKSKIEIPRIDETKKKQIKLLWRNGNTIEKICKQLNLYMGTVEYFTSNFNKGERVTTQQIADIIKFGAHCSVPVEYLAPYVKCSIYKCKKILSKYTIRQPIHHRTEQEKHQDWAVLNSYIM